MSPHRGFLRAVPMIALLVTQLGLASSAIAASGDLDPSFGTGGKVLTDIAPNGIVQALALQPDDKILAVGSAPGFGGENTFALARYNPDGNLDTTFGNGGVVTTDFGSSSFGGGASAVALQPDGKIIAVGESFGDFALARYNPDGSLDGTFGSGGTVTIGFGFSDEAARAVTVDPDGKIRVAGLRSPFDRTTIDFVLARFNADGSLDATFGAGGEVISPFGPSNGTMIFTETFQADGRILAAGIAFAEFAPFGSNGDFALARYNADGSPDTGFGTGGRLTTDFAAGSEDQARAVAIQPDGKLVAAGSSGGFPGYALARYNPDGSLDISFGVGGKVVTNVFSPAEARAVAIEFDGHILAAGSTNIFSGDFGLVRYTAAGALDSSFGTGGAVITDFVGGDDRANAIALQPDGRILIAGFANDGSVFAFALARYLTTSTAVEVTIDIKPGSDSNLINLSGQALIPVAILTTARFDASTVNPGTVCFGDAEEPSQRDCSGVHPNVADIDNDGDRDLRLLFETQQTGIDAEDTQACLTGSLLDTTQIEGCDFIRIS
jgi:uncharacterized delta-60 repeat protein